MLCLHLDCGGYLCFVGLLLLLDGDLVCLYDKDLCCICVRIVEDICALFAKVIDLCYVFFVSDIDLCWGLLFLL